MERMTQVAYVGAGGHGAVGYADATAPEPRQPMSDDAGHALSLTYGMHSLLDEIEDRLFGPQPRPVSGGASDPKTRPALADTVTETRQRVETANDRLSILLSRL